MSWPRRPRTLRQHGLSDDALRAVLQAIITNKLNYASPAWWGSPPQTIVIVIAWKHFAQIGYRANSSTTFASICAMPTIKLFTRLSRNSQHLLHPLLPPGREQHYSLRDRSHNYQLPVRTSILNDSNFITRMLYNY